MDIMIAVDETPESHEALDVAFDFFGNTANYVVCTIAETPLSYSLAAPMGGFRDSANLKALYDAARTEAAKLATDARTVLPDSAQIAVQVGAPGPAICRLAVELEIDLVVLGSKHRSIWERILDGSVGRYVIDHAPCPVLIVR